MNPNKPAFPYSGSWSETGITIRDYIAIEAMKALISKMPLFDREGQNGEKRTQGEIEQVRVDIAQCAYLYADALIAESNKK